MQVDEEWERDARRAGRYRADGAAQISEHVWVLPLSTSVSTNHCSWCGRSRIILLWSEAHGEYRPHCSNCGKPWDPDEAHNKGLPFRPTAFIVQNRRPGEDSER